MVPFTYSTDAATMQRVIGKLRFVGLTGGIGTGKSTVGQMLREAGVPVTDADVLAREVVLPGQPAHAEIAAAWPDVIQPDGTIDRRKLGHRVFSDPAARARLEAITHPRIQDKAMAWARELEAAGHRLAFYEASLLVETGGHRRFDGLVVVTANEEQQLARVTARDHLTREQALARLRAQMPAEEKRRAATHLIDNSGDLESTRRQVAGLIAALTPA
jgi:dephospho-CoA kinase